MRDRQMEGRLRRLFGDATDSNGATDAGRTPLGAAILALARKAAAMHREADRAEYGDGVWPAEGLLTVSEYAALLGIDLDGDDAEVRS